MAAVAGPLAALHSRLCGVELVSFYLLDLRVSGPAIFRDFEIESCFLSKFDFGISICGTVSIFQLFNFDGPNFCSAFRGGGGQIGLRMRTQESGARISHTGGTNAQHLDIWLCIIVRYICHRALSTIVECLQST